MTQDRIDETVKARIQVMGGSEGMTRRGREELEVGMRGIECLAGR